MTYHSLSVPLLRLALLATALGCQQSLSAAEQVVMRFVESPRTSDYVVKLGDLVEVLAGNSPSIEKLMQLPLGPAPRENNFQSWHSSDVLQHLELRGIHSNSIRWSGIEQTKLQRLAAMPNTTSGIIEPAFVQGRTIELAANLVSQAIEEYLALKTGERTDWIIRVEIPAKLADVIRIRRNIVGIGGGAPPWLGEQEFILQIKDRDQIVNVPIQAHVELPPMVLVAKRPLRRDEILVADILELAPLPQSSGEDQSKYFSDIQQLIGQQLKRSVSTGLPISSDIVGAPVVITRNEMIEVESVSGGVSVRTMARSLASGAVGDLIDIEVIPSKQRMLATVVEPLKVRVASVSARGGLSRSGTK